MKLNVICSGSKGNCYVIHNNTEALVLECGAPLMDVAKRLPLGVRIVGTLLTHEHMDHAKYVNQWLDHGMSVYATKGTIEALEDRGNLSLMKAITPVEKMVPTGIGNYRVIPFGTVHDAKEPCGYYIHHKEMGNMLFATDTNYVPNKFHSLNHILIEANFSDERLAAREDIPESLKERIKGSHMSVDTCTEALLANDLKDVRNVMLIHISGGSGDPIEFREKVEKAIGKDVLVASPGVEVAVNLFPF